MLYPIYSVISLHYIHTTWDENCLKLLPKIGKFVQDAQGYLRVGMVDIDKIPREIVEALKVTTVPTVFAFRILK